MFFDSMPSMYPASRRLRLLVLLFLSAAALPSPAADSAAVVNETTAACDARALREAASLASRLKETETRIAAALSRVQDAASAETAAAELAPWIEPHTRLAAQALALQNGLSLEAQLRFNQEVFGSNSQAASALHAEFERLSDADFYGSRPLRTAVESIIFPELGETE